MLELALLFASALCAVVPLTAALAAVWWLDRYDREPVWLIALTFCWGAFGAVPLAVAAASMLTGAPASAIDGTTWPNSALGLVVAAPLVEEPAKALVLLAIMATRHFDDMTDGFVYGAAAGLGFAMVENLLYFGGAIGDPSTWAGTVVVRTFFSANMHAMATAIAGAALGWAKFRGPRAWWAAGALGLVLAMGVHGLWNGLLAAEELLDAGGRLVGLDMVLLSIEMALVALFFELCIQEEASTIRRELMEEAQRGLLPIEHPPILAHWVRRLRSDWLPDDLDRDAYVRAATLLAVRKRQSRLLGERATEHHRAEIERLREQIVELLSARAQPVRAATST